MSQVTCQICTKKVHVIQTHLSKDHPEVTLDQYRDLYPMAPILSGQAEELVRRKLVEQNKVSKSVVVDAAPASETTGPVPRPLHEVFGFGTAPAARNSRGDAIMIQVHNPDGDVAAFVPEYDPGYIFDIALTKTTIQAMEMNIPALLWGHAGTGKTTMIEQVCAHTQRGFLRLQHTANTEESDVEGRYKIVNGEQVWEDGPLPLAMRLGLVYCADEYDFASPMVLSLYQAVLEGKSLYIKACNKRVAPHPNFRFFGTGNTNGAGDDTGLYQGTQLQNAANYERFGIVEKVEYMPIKQEAAILQGRFGIANTDALRLVRFANAMREAFERKEVAIPMSLRSLQRAASLGMARNDYTFGLTRSYINRLPGMSAAFATEVMQREFT